jgi:hypothetical protein
VEQIVLIHLMPGPSVLAQVFFDKETKENGRNPVDNLAEKSEFSIPDCNQKRFLRDVGNLRRDGWAGAIWARRALEYLKATGMDVLDFPGT